MSWKGREVIGEMQPELLIADPRFPVDVCSVIILAGQGSLKRRTALAINTEGKCVILGTENTKASYILAEDVEAAEEDVMGVAYNSGKFARNALIVKEGYTMKKEDEAALRDAGIYLENIML